MIHFGNYIVTYMHTRVCDSVCVWGGCLKGMKTKYSKESTEAETKCFEKSFC